MTMTVKREERLARAKVDNYILNNGFPEGKGQVNSYVVLQTTFREDTIKVKVSGVSVRDFTKYEFCVILDRKDKLKVKRSFLVVE